MNADRISDIIVLAVAPVADNVRVIDIVGIVCQPAVNLIASRSKSTSEIEFAQIIVRDHRPSIPVGGPWIQFQAGRSLPDRMFSVFAGKRSMSSDAGCLFPSVRRRTENGKKEAKSKEKIEGKNV